MREKRTGRKRGMDEGCATGYTRAEAGYKKQGGHMEARETPGRKSRDESDEEGRDE